MTLTTFNYEDVIKGVWGQSCQLIYVCFIAEQYPFIICIGFSFFFLLYVNILAAATCCCTGIHLCCSFRFLYVFTWRLSTADKVSINQSINRLLLSYYFYMQLSELALWTRHCTTPTRQTTSTTFPVVTWVGCGSLWSMTARWNDWPWPWLRPGICLLRLSKLTYGHLQTVLPGLILITYFLNLIICIAYYIISIFACFKW